MIVEGLLTTIGDEGQVNVAPMGPVVDGRLTHFVLRPFQPSTTFANLKRSRRAVFHITDDACLIARAAIGRIPTNLPMERLPDFDGYRLTQACRWYALEVDEIDDAQPRTTMPCRVVSQGFMREFIGFHRARHGLIEAAILATRVHLLKPSDIRRHWDILRTMVEKTGDAEHLEAFEQLEAYIRSSITSHAPAEVGRRKE